MVDFDLVKRISKALNMSDNHVMQTTFVELMEDMVNELDAKNEHIEKLKEECEILTEMKESLVNEILTEMKESLVNENSQSIENSFINASINDYCREAHNIAKSKGWYDEPTETGTRLALIHSEVSEALEALRNGNEENFIEELADVCIRVFDLSEYLAINLGQAIDKKMEKNRTRSYKHGGKLF